MPMNNEKGAVRPPHKTLYSPSVNVGARPSATGIRVIADIVHRTTVSTEPVPVFKVGPACHSQMPHFYCHSNLNKYCKNAGEQSAEYKNGNGKLQYRDDNGRNQQNGQVAPHNLPVYRTATSRGDERRENRENQRSECREEVCEYIIHDDKRPRTQLMLTLRLLWRSGKRIRHNTMAWGINSLMPRIRRLSAVSRVRIAALTIPALLLCACASAHGYDACSAPYASTGQHLYGGRPA